MPGNMLAGIVWDSREPLPPELRDEPEIPYLPLPSSHPDNIINNIHHVHQVGHKEDLDIREPDRNILPPLSTSLRARIVQDTAMVTVTQLFWNNTSTSIHMGSYTFPLPAGCTVTDFSCRVGRDRIVRAKAKSKQEARNAFDRAIRNNQTAGLLEQDTTEIFTTTLGNISANTRLRAEISFVTLLKHRFEDGRSTTTLTIPTYIAARYGNSPPGFQNATPSRSLQGLSIEIEVVTAETVPKISSSTHNITVERGIGMRQFENWQEFAAAIRVNDVQTSSIKLEEGSTCLDKDFVLDIATQQQDGIEVPHAWLEVHPSFENHKAVMLTIPPNLILRNESSSENAEILFLADRSGSMVDKMESLRSAMAFFLNGIPLGRKFNIWCFGSGHISLWSGSRDYSEQTLDAALTYVKRQFRADLGGTELLGALKQIVRARDLSRMADIVVLTDGEVWRLDETVDFVQQTRRETEGRVRFFALGIGNAVSHELVEGIAKAGGGYAEVIPAASQGGWEDRVVAMLRAALKGHIGPLRIEFDDDPEGGAPDEHFYNGAVSHRRPRFLQSPADISALSPFLRNRVFFLFDSQTSLPSLDNINIKSTSPGGAEVVTRVLVRPVEKKEIPIHKLGARALLGDLERGQSWIHMGPNRPLGDSTEEESLVRREGESLGCKWSLVSKWTSFYAVEEPYEVGENAPDSFLDIDNVHVNEADRDLGLLRPRVAPGERVDGVMPDLQTMAAAELDDELEKGDDHDDTSSDSESLERGNDSGSDSGDEDDGDNPRGGGAAGGHGDNGGEDQQESDSGEGTQEGHEQGSKEGGEEGPTSNGSNEASSSGRAHILAAGLPSTFHTTMHDVTYEDPQTHAPPTRYRPKTQFRLSTYPSSTNEPKSLKLMNRLRMKSSTTKDVFNEFSFGTKSWNPDTSYVGGNTYDRKNISKKHKNGRNMSPPQLASTRSFHFGTKDPSRRSYESTFEAVDDSRHLPRFASSYPASINCDTEAIRAVAETDTSNTFPTFSLPRSGDTCPDFVQGTSLDSPKLDFGNFSADLDDTWSFRTSTITAPNFNLPASGALISNQKSVVKIDEESEGEDLVAKLLIFQKFDGAFRFNDQDQVKSLLGDDFGIAIKELALKPEFQGVDIGLLTNIAIVVFLELKFRFCEDLWVLMVNKARAYVDGKLLEEGILAPKETLYKLTELQLVNLKLPTSKSKTRPKIQPETLPPTETELSAIFMSITSPRKRPNSRSHSRETLTPSLESGGRTPTLTQKTTTGRNPSVPVGASSKSTPRHLRTKRHSEPEKIDSVSQLAHAPTAMVMGRVLLESAPFDD